MANTNFKKEVKNTNKKMDSKPKSKITFEDKAISNNTIEDNEDIEKQKKNTSNVFDNESAEFEAFKNQSNNEVEKQNNSASNKEMINSKIESNSNNKEKTWIEKLNEEDPQYLKVINFIEMISNCIKQVLVNNSYNLSLKYQQLGQVKFWDFVWNSVKTNVLKTKAVDKKLYNEIFDDAILLNSNSITNECTYILKSNNFITFTFGYDKKNLNFYFASEHSKYAKIDSKTIDNIFKKKYEVVFCKITSQNNIELF